MSIKCENVTCWLVKRLFVDKKYLKMLTFSSTVSYMFCSWEIAQRKSVKMIKCTKVYKLFYYVDSTL